MRSLNLTRPHVRGPEVEAWQRFLRREGFYKAPIDGDFGGNTEAATLRRQQLTIRSERDLPQTVLSMPRLSRELGEAVSTHR